MNYGYLMPTLVTLSNRLQKLSKVEELQPIIDVDVLAFWKGKQYTDQELHAISNLCFAVPPTQVTIERAFSTLRLVLTDYRNRLSQEVLENILLTTKILKVKFQIYNLKQQQHLCNKPPPLASIHPFDHDSRQQRRSSRGG
ncbi:hypothetical protein ACLKA6_001442 [Drosophila palustris]